MNQFMLNNEDKIQFIQLIITFVETNQYLALQDILQTDFVVLSGDNDCCLVQLGNVEERYHLTSNQEAETEVTLHSLDVLNNTDMFVYLRSPSGDTDILVLALGIIRDHKERVFYDYGNGNHRKFIWLSSLEMDENHRDTVIGFHSFTGTDYTSAFFRKGKKRCWSVMQSDTVLGSNWNVDQNLECLLEEDVCSLYGEKKLSVNEVRFCIFQKKH